jgi:hypothetical protein
MSVRSVVVATALVTISIAACSRAGGSAAEKTTASSGRASGGTKLPVPAAACDDYIRIATKCIEAKMPESDRAEARADLDSYQKSLKAFGTMTSMAETHCTNTMTLEFRQDSYGCYGEEAARRGIQTACTLLTRAELEAIVHTPLDEARPGNGKCTFGFSGQPYSEGLVITAHWKDGHDEVAAARAAKAIVAGGLAKDVGKNSDLMTLVSGDNVEGVGDEAYFTMAGIHPMLVARLGQVAIGVEGVERDQAIAIAQKALPRITPDSERQ